MGSLSLYCKQREGVLRVLQCTVHNITNIDTTRMGEPGRTNRAYISPLVDRGSLANHGARVSVGRFEQLNITISYKLVLKRGDPCALLGSIIISLYFLIFSQFLGQFFSNQLYSTVYAIYFASLIFRESGLQDISASG